MLHWDLFSDLMAPAPPVRAAQDLKAAVQTLAGGMALWGGGVAALVDAAPVRRAAARLALGLPVEEAEQLLEAAQLGPSTVTAGDGLGAALRAEWLALSGRLGPALELLAHPALQAAPAIMWSDSQRRGAVETALVHAACVVADGVLRTDPARRSTARGLLVRCAARRFELLPLTDTCEDTVQLLGECIMRCRHFLGLSVPPAAAQRLAAAPVFVPSPSPEKADGGLCVAVLHCLLLEAARDGCRQEVADAFEVAVGRVQGATHRRMAWRWHLRWAARTGEGLVALAERAAAACPLEIVPAAADAAVCAARPAACLCEFVSELGCILEGSGLDAAAQRLCGRPAHAAGLVARNAGRAVARGETERAMDMLAFGIEASPESSLLWRMAVALEWDSDRTASTRWLCRSAVKAVPRCAALWTQVIQFEWESGSSTETVLEFCEHFVDRGVRMDLDWMQ